MTLKKHEIFSLVILCSVSLLAQTNISGVGMISVSYYGSDSDFNFILPEAYGQTPEPYVYRGDIYIETNFFNGTAHQSIGGAGVYVENGAIDPVNGKPSFVPYILDDQSTHTTFETGSISWTFHKDTCTWQLYEGGRIAGKSPVIENISITFQEKVGQSWQNLPHNDEICDVTINELPNNVVQLIATQGNESIGYTEIELIQEGGRDLETWYRSPVDTVGGKQYGFVESHVKNQDVEFKQQQYGLGIVQEVQLAKSKFRDELDGFDIPITIKNENGKVEINLKDSVHNTLEKAVIKKYQPDKLQTFFDFHNTPPLNQGERLEIDPTYSSASPTIDDELRDTSNNGLCDTYSDSQSSTHWRVGWADSPGSADCHRSFGEWSTASIPDTATIDDVDVTLEVTSVSSGGANCDVVQMDSQPSVTAYSTLFSEIGSETTIYLNDNSFCDTVATNVTIDLGTTADSDLEGLLGSDYFAIGVREYGGSQDSTDRRKYICGSASSCTPDPTLDVTYTTSCTPNAPTSPTAESSSTSQIDLTWVAPTNCTSPQAVKVERSPDGSTGWTTIYSSTTKTSHSDTGLSSNEDYFYRISYQSSVADGSLWGSTTSNVSDLTTPAQVAGLTATAQNSTQINTSWTASSGSGTVTYDVERRDGTQYGGVCSGFGAWSVVSNDQSGTTYNNNGLSTTTCYEYRVNAKNSDSTGAYSATATDTTFPSAPTSLSVLTFSDTRIDLSWTAPVNSNVDGYKIERESPVGGGWSTLVADTGTTDVTYSDTGLSASTQYNYRVSALNGVDSSVPSNTAEDTTQGVPAQVTGLTVTPVSETQLDLVWIAPSSDPALTGYKIERESPVGGGWSTLVADTGNTLIYYNNTGLTSGTEYNYRVSGINSLGIGTASVGVYNDTIAGTPTGLTATATTSTNIDLSWTAPTPSGEINGYKIERESPVGGGWSTLVANTTTTSTAYSDSTVTGAVEYNYRVSAYTESNIAGNTSAASSDWTWAEVVTSFTASAEDDDQIDLDWTNPSGTLTGFLIERESPVGGGWSTLVNDTTTTQNWYNATGLSANTQYNFRVSAWSLGGAGDTATAFTNTTTTAPTSLIVNDCYHTCTTQLNLEWTAPSPATGVNGYKIERESPIGGGWSTLVANTSNTNTYYNNTALIAGTFYNYKVSALNEFGSSETSNSYAYSPHKKPYSVDDLIVTDNGLLQFVLTWTAPDKLFGTLSGYNINYTTPAGDPLTVYVEDTGSTSTTVTIPAFDPTLEYSFRVSAVTNHGNNATFGNIGNHTLTTPLEVGALNFTTSDNTNIIPYSFVVYPVNVSTDNVQVRFDQSLTTDCTIESTISGDSSTHTSLSETLLTGNTVYHNFTMTNSGNDILEFNCNDQTDPTINGQFLFSTEQSVLGNTAMPLVGQVQNFTAGLYGTEGEFGEFDLITLFVIILSMLGFNRKHPALGVGFMVVALGATRYYGLIGDVSLAVGGLAMISALAIGVGLKKF